MPAPCYGGPDYCRCPADCRREGYCLAQHDVIWGSDVCHRPPELVVCMDGVRHLGAKREEPPEGLSGGSGG